MPELIGQYFANVRCISQVVGYPPDVILDTANKEAVDMIVIGTHGRRGVKAQFFGPVAEKVTKQASMPVLIIRPM